MPAVKPWARNYVACIVCGRTSQPHRSKGVCNTCRCREYQRGRPRRLPNPDAWSLHHARCVECGTTELVHAGHGLCFNCYHRNDMRQRAAAKREAV